MGLAELIRDVTRRAVSDDPLDRLAAAADHQRELAEQLDEMLDHFVREARAAGRSWTEIGDVLGVSKQAAQQRHRPGSREGRRASRRGRFARFSPDARSVVVDARAAARTLGHPAIGTEHVLLGLLDSADAPAVDLLSRWEIDRDEIEAAVVARAGDTPAAGDDRSLDRDRGRGRGRRRGHIPFTRPAKKVLELALRESHALEHRSIGTEHVLLGLLRAEEGLAAQLLQERGVTYRAVRDAVREAVSADPT